MTRNTTELAKGWGMARVLVFALCFLFAIGFLVAFLVRVL